MLNKVALIFVLIYLTPGVLLGIDHYFRESNTFECKSPQSPHGYITIWKAGGGNPDPQSCVSRVEKRNSMKEIPLLILMGTPLIIMKILH